MVESIGWASKSHILVEVGSSLVLNWLLKKELRSREIQLFFMDIDCKRQRGRALSFDKAEKRGNEMAFALAMDGINRAETFKVWW